MNKKEFKIFAAGLTVSGSIIGFLDNIVFPYNYLRIDAAGDALPVVVRNLGWLLTRSAIDIHLFRYSIQSS